MKLPARQSDTKPVSNFKRLLRENVRLARKTASFSSRAIDLLASITREFQFSFKAGELQVINGNWYVTHTGLLRLHKTQMGTGMALAPKSATVCARSSGSTSSTLNCRC